MDSIIFTPRLKLTLVTKAERGSSELEWFHEIRSDAKATQWSITGQSKSVEDTEKSMERFLPTTEGEKSYRVLYAVHEVLESEGEPQNVELGKRPTKFIGTVALKSLDASSLALADEFTLPPAASTPTPILTVELAYAFLPSAWGKGYATESVSAVFESCPKGQSFWAPFPALYVRAIVNEGNPPSMRVMDKAGMARSGIYEWTGKIFLGGEWRYRDGLHIFGKYLLL